MNTESKNKIKWHVCANNKNIWLEGRIDQDVLFIVNHTVGGYLLWSVKDNQVIPCSPSEIVYVHLDMLKFTAENILNTSSTSTTYTTDKPTFTWAASGKVKIYDDIINLYRCNYSSNIGVVNDGVTKNEWFVVYMRDDCKWFPFAFTQAYKSKKAAIKVAEKILTFENIEK